MADKDQIVNWLNDVHDMMGDQYAETFCGSSEYEIDGDTFTAEEIRKARLVVSNIIEGIEAEVYMDER